MPVASSIANSTVQSNPCRTERILAICGIPSSDRYSSSPVINTMCFPLPGPSLPANLIHPSAMVLHGAHALRQIANQKRRATTFRDLINVLTRFIGATVVTKFSENVNPFQSKPISENASVSSPGPSSIRTNFLDDSAHWKALQCSN